MEKQYVAQAISEMIDLEVHEEIHQRYAKALANSMQNTKAVLLRQLLDDAITIPVHSHEIKVDFDGKE